MIKDAVSHRTDIEPRRTRGGVIKDIQTLVPLGAPRPSDPLTIGRLTHLTGELIGLSGGIEILRDKDPYREVLERKLPIEPSVADHLKGKKILITGGEGLVGQRLIRQLKEDFSVANIASVDIAGNDHLYGEEDPNIKYHTGDICDSNALSEIFNKEKPNIVFHLAAISEVGEAQNQKAATIKTQIVGTRNIIALCEETGVDDCVYSSTGKAAQYVTHGIFGSTVKIIEGQLAVAAGQENSSVRYGMARFTHVVENSNLVDDITNGIENGLVFLHTPDRNIYAQGVDEATTSLLNALTISKEGKMQFGSVREIGFPVNNLDIALHQIAKSGRVVPIYFSGVETGYDPETFNGQLDIERAKEGEVPSVMANVLETANLSVTSTGGTIVAELAPFSVEEFESNVKDLQVVLKDEDSEDENLEAALEKTVKGITRSQFDQIDTAVLLKILRWGSASSDPQIHRDTFSLLLHSLEGRITPEKLHERVFGAPPIEKTFELLDFMKEELTPILV